MNFLKAWLDFLKDAWFHIGIEGKVKPALPMYTVASWWVTWCSEFDKLWCFPQHVTLENMTPKNQLARCIFLKTSYKLWNVPF